jgi:hypothetical protein
VTDTQPILFQAIVTEQDDGPALCVMGPGAEVRIWAIPPHPKHIAFFDALCDRINGIGTPAAATLDLTPKPGKPTLADALVWVGAGFWLGVFTVYVAEKIAR